MGHKEDVELAELLNKLLIYKILEVTDGINMIQLQDYWEQENNQEHSEDHNLDVADVQNIKKEMYQLVDVDNIRVVEQTKFL